MFMPTSVLLVGCCEVDWLGFRRLSNTSDPDLVFHAREPYSALQQLAKSNYDVVMVDVHVAGIGPIELIQSIRDVDDDPSILLFAMHENPAVLIQAASLGVLGGVLYSDPYRTIVQRIREAADGQSAWSREDLRRLTLSSSSTVSGDGYPVPLTYREKDILAHLVKGGTNKEIASGLGISYETVKEHIQNILSKVGVNDRSQAAIWAVHNNVV
jgi:DNA-binding NarL/FixJ family response regulator